MVKIKKTMSVKTLLLIVKCLLLINFVSCSSKPKNPGDIFVIRSQAESWLESGNREAGQGNFQNALAILTETKRYAILADDPSLIIRAALARANVLFSLDRVDEAFEEWNYAIKEAVRFGDNELLSVSRIFLARGYLITGRKSARSILEEVTRESVNIRNSRAFISFSWQVRGLAHRSLNQWSEAEEAFRRSLEINERDRYLEGASYDWFSIASVRSLSGDFQGALRALESSIAIDRRIENSWGLAASYRAMGDVYKRAGRSREAIDAYERSMAIFTAMGNDRETVEIERRMELFDN